MASGMGTFTLDGGGARASKDSKPNIHSVIPSELAH